MRETRVIIRYLISLLLFIGARTSEPLRQFKQQNNILFLFSQHSISFFIAIIRIIFQLTDYSIYFENHYICSEPIILINEKDFTFE